MSAQTTCNTCRAVLPATARFCPECGTRVGETGAAAAQVRTFNVAPPSLLLAVSAGLIVLGVVLLALQHWLFAAIALALGAAMAAMYAGTRNGSARSRQRLAKFRSRSRAAVETMAAQAQARREHLALRRELGQLHDRRSSWLRDLGLAVYDEDTAGTERGKQAIRELDEEIAAKEEQMTHVALRAQERVQQVQAESRPTELLEPPAPVPEPYPPPDEGTPPMPAPVPEPYPPPDEGTPPTPTPVPEPYPPPDEGRPQQRQ